jgi:ribonuclease R
MARYGEQSTLQEIKAEEAERELLDIKKAQYMKQFVGEIFHCPDFIHPGLWVLCRT